MKKKALALAVAGAFFAPASYAAQDTSGMQYTSAAEGFYASIRAQFSTEKKTDGGAGIGNSSSRFGVRGSNDLGGGLKGFYQYEAGVGIDNGSGLSTRVGQVGLEGAFGRVWAGSGWVETHNMTYGSTDIANAGSGNLTYSTIRPGRGSNMIQYRTPDIGGFQGALGLNMKAGADNDQMADDKKDDNNIEMWSAAGKYSVQGFTGAFAYSVRPDTTMSYDDDGLSTTDNVNSANKEDYSGWTARLGYAQDNWYVNGWYGKDNNSDFMYDNVTRGGSSVAIPSPEDKKFVSIAGGVSVQKVNMYALWEQSDDGMNKDANTVIGVQYNLGSRSRVWMDYNGRDHDSDATAEDNINIGLRHDF